MAKKFTPPEGQLGLFDFASLPEEAPATSVALEKAVEKWEETRVVETKFSNSERKMWDEFVLLIGWALAAPSAPKVDDHLTRTHEGDVVLERFVRIFKYFQEEREMMDKAKSDADKEAVFNAMIKRWQKLRQQVTDREICIIFAQLSQSYPLTQDMAAEYMRAFASSYGLEKYMTAQMDFLPLDYRACKNFRRTHPGLAEWFPELDEAWFNDFNRKGSMQALLNAPVREEQPEFCQIVF